MHDNNHHLCCKFNHHKMLVVNYGKVLADYELIELLLTYAIPRVDTKPTAKALLKQFKTIFYVLQQPYERLLMIKGIGPETATYISLIQACLTRAMEETVEHRETVSGPEDK